MAKKDVVAQDSKIEEQKTWKDRVKHFLRYSMHTWIARCFFIAFGMELLLEILGRRSIWLGVKFMLSSPIVFFYNTIIIFFTYLFALFFRKRIFAMALISVLWLGCGIANFVVLGYRITPFAAIDFVMVGDVLSMLDVYFAKWQQVLLAVVIVAVLVGIVVLFRKTPKFEGKKHLFRTMIFCVVIWSVLTWFTSFNVNHNIISDDFANLGMAYQDYGFAYCFTNSIIDNGIAKPTDYSEQTMQKIKYELTDQKLTNEKKKKTPNIICVQLESFFDPNVVDGLELSENPIPTFTALREKFPSGYLTVPALGAGTANTEFEILTGIKSGFFGAGEYPYKTTVNEKPIEGMASLLKKEGYSAFAIHNNKASFYDRRHVYDEMGFDHFISLEYMNHVDRTPTGWAKDYSLIEDIISCIRSTQTKDFVYTISVQGHGKYPEEAGVCDEVIKVSYPQDPVKQNQLSYYINQIHEMDIMIHDLVYALDNTGEEYVLLLYGDHLPTITFADEQLPHTQFQTQYILVNNMNLELEDEDIETTQMSTKIFRALDLDLGYVMDAHSIYEGTRADEVIQLLAYDMLFGENYIYDGKSPVEDEIPMKLGLREISIRDVSNEVDHAVIKGYNFNEFSHVYLDDEELETIYVDSYTLMVVNTVFEQGANITVKQLDESGHILSTSDGFEFK
ncbi:MAG: LTA synthase family protein [Wujia sp.]